MVRWSPVWRRAHRVEGCGGVARVVHVRDEERAKLLGGGHAARALVHAWVVAPPRSKASWLSLQPAGSPVAPFSARYYTRSCLRLRGAWASLDQPRPASASQPLGSRWPAMLGLVLDIACRRGGSSGSARAWSLLSTACVPGSVNAIQLERKASTYACQRARARVRRRGGRQAAGRGAGWSGSGSRAAVLGRQARRWHGLRSSGAGAPRFRSGRPSSTARGAPPRRAVAESSRRLCPTRRQPTRLPPTRRARRARQRCGWRRSQAPGASHDCCGCAAAAVAPLRCGCAGCSAAPALLHGQFARVSPRRADQTVARACSGATESGDCCSSGVGQPR